MKEMFQDVQEQYLIETLHSNNHSTQDAVVELLQLCVNEEGEA